MTVAKEPGRRGEREVSRKPPCREGRIASAEPVCSCAFSIRISCTRDRGCSAHPAFPAPSTSRRVKDDANLGRIAPRDCGCVFETAHIVVPANAGTHNHRPVLLRESRRTASPKTTAAAYGSRRSPGGWCPQLFEN